MPNEYELTIGKVQKYINDDQICAILNSSDYTIANKRILNCLIERMNYRAEILDLCDQLENITTSQDLKIVVNDLRHGTYCCCAFVIKITIVATLCHNNFSARSSAKYSVSSKYNNHHQCSNVIIRCSTT